MKRLLPIAARLALLTVACRALTSCGSSGDSTTTPVATTYTIGGTVTGLTGTGLVLQDNGGANLTVTANGTFTFGTAIANAGAYAVTVSTQPTGQTCTVTAGSGTVGTANVTNVAVTCVATTYTVSVTVSGLTGTLVLQDNGASNLTFTSSGTAAFGTALTTGTAYAVTVLTQPSSQTCVIANGSGTIGSANVTNVTATCTTLTEFLYGGNSSFGISAFSINTGTGAITALSGSPFAPQSGITGSFGFVTGATIGNVVYFSLGEASTVTTAPSIEAWSANSVTGALTAVSGSPFVGVYPVGPLAMTPSGSFAYGPNILHANSSNTVFPASISAYSVASSTGAITPITGSPFEVDSLGAQPASVIVTQNGKFLYVANAGITGSPGNIMCYSINSTTGALTLVSTTAAAADSIGVIFSQLAISPNGSFLYVSGGGASGGLISAYSINSTTGALTQISGSPYASVAIATGIAFTSGGNFMYVGGASSNGVGTGGVYGYTVNTTTGALTAISGSPFNTGPYVLSTVIDASNQYLYTSEVGMSGNNNFSGVGGYSINQTSGALTQLSGSPFNSATTLSATGIYFLTILK